MRTRMSGGVGRVTGDGDPYPILAIVPTVAQVSLGVVGDFTQLRA